MLEWSNLLLESKYRKSIRSSIRILEVTLNLLTVLSKYESSCYFIQHRVCYSSMNDIVTLLPQFQLKWILRLRVTSSDEPKFALERKCYSHSLSSSNIFLNPLKFLRNQRSVNVLRTLDIKRSSQILTYLRTHVTGLTRVLAIKVWPGSEPARWCF